MKRMISAGVIAASLCSVGRGASTPRRSPSAWEAFHRDRRMRQPVERNVAVIGEAINRLLRRDPDVARRVSGIQRIVGMRNAVVHRHDVIDDEHVWHAIHERLPGLRDEIDALLPEEDR